MTCFWYTKCFQSWGHLIFVWASKRFLLYLFISCSSMHLNVIYGPFEINVLLRVVCPKSEQHELYFRLHLTAAVQKWTEISHEPSASSYLLSAGLSALIGGRMEVTAEMRCSVWTTSPDVDELQCGAPTQSSLREWKCLQLSCHTVQISHSNFIQYRSLKLTSLTSCYTTGLQQRAHSESRQWEDI